MQAQAVADGIAAWYTTRLGRISGDLIEAMADGPDDVSRVLLRLLEERFLAEAEAARQRQQQG